MQQLLTLTQALKKAAIEDSHNITFIFAQDKEKVISYKELYKSALSYLGYFQKKGIKKNNELILQIADIETFLYSFWACLLGGIIPVPVSSGNYDESKNKLLLIWKNLKTPFLFTEKKSLDYLNEYAKKSGNDIIISEINKKSSVIEDVEFDDSKNVKEVESEINDIAFLQFSSGSTGFPKGVILTHKNVMTNICSIIKAIKLCKQDTLLSWMPLTHDMGLIGFHLVPIVKTINQILMPTNLFIRNPVLWLEKASEHKISVLSSPNFGYKYLLKFFKNEKEYDLDLSNVRLIFNGAEPISFDLCEKFLKSLEKYHLKDNCMFPVYGMAEASLAVTFPPVEEKIVCNRLKRNSLQIGSQVQYVNNADDNGVAFVDVGYVLDNCNLKICDDKDRILEDGFIGNIQISGDNVTSGYYNNLEETLSVKTKDNWLKTGDVGYLNKNRLVVTGRSKEIIFVNGQNFYPYDIESVIVKEAGLDRYEIVACGVFDHKKQMDEALIFVFFKETLEKFVTLIPSIRKAVTRNFGIEVNSILPVKKLPKTTSGKVQRFKLANQYTMGEFSDLIKILEGLSTNIKENLDDIFENMSPIELKLQKIWIEILNLENVGLTENFFEIGGSSLKATILGARISKEFDVEIPIGEIFEYLTIEKQAEYIAKAERKPYISIPKISGNEFYQVSSAQNRQFVMNKLQNGGVVYNVPTALIIAGKLNQELFRSAWKEIVNRHEILRTCFITKENNVFQKINTGESFDIEFMDCQEKFKSLYEKDLIDEEIQKLIKNFIQPFNLEVFPLLRVKLIQLESEKYLWIVDIHHIIFDGFSYKILFDEFFKLYNGQVLELPKIQYKDYADWQNRKIQTNELKMQEEYWTSLLVNPIKHLNLQLDYQRPKVQCFEGEKIRFLIENELLIQLEKLAVKTDTTLFTLLLAVYNVHLYKYSGCEDIIVGSPIACRTNTELENMIGMFANTIVYRNTCRDDLSFRDFLKNVKDGVLKALENQEYPFEKILDKIAYKRSSDRNPLFDTVFVLQNMDLPELHINNLQIIPYEIDRKITHFDFWLQAIKKENSIQCDLEYCTKLFKRSTMEKFGDKFKCLLKIIVSNPEIKISDVIIMSEGEIELISKFSENHELQYDFI